MGREAKLTIMRSVLGSSGAVLKLMISDKRHTHTHTRKTELVMFQYRREGDHGSWKDLRGGLLYEGGPCMSSSSSSSVTQTPPSPLATCSMPLDFPLESVRLTISGTFAPFTFSGIRDAGVSIERDASFAPGFCTSDSYGGAVDLPCTLIVLVSMLNEWRREEIRFGRDSISGIPRHELID